MVDRHVYLLHVYNRNATKRSVLATRGSEINLRNIRRTTYVVDHVDAHVPKSAAESPSKAIFWHVYDVFPFGDLQQSKDQTIYSS